MYVLPKDEEKLKEIISRIDGLVKASPQGTRKKLGDFLKLNANTITNWFNGRNKSWRSRLEEIAEFFEVSVDFLLTGEEPSEEQKENPPDQKVKGPLEAKRDELFAIAQTLDGSDLELVLEMAKKMSELRGKQ